MLIVGAHMSIAKGFLEAVQKTVVDYQANCLQIFVKSPRGRAEKPLDHEEAEKTSAFIKKHDVKFMVAHCSYLLNFAKDHYHDAWPQASLVSDMKKIHLLGGNGVVLHIGKYLELSKQSAYENIKKNIMMALSATKHENNLLMLENTAGQGTEIGYRFEELAELYKVLEGHPRIRFCFDTQHAFAAGYDFELHPEKIFRDFEDCVGKGLIALFHLNNSKKPLGARVDRHENLELGLMRIEAFKWLADYANKHSIPMVLETPDIDRHKGEVAMIKKWIR